MEFKGTKGKWKLANNEYGYFTSVRNLDDTRKICVSRVNNQTENNANLLLISKAPEMFEMLSEIVNLFKRGEFDTDENIGGRTLIKAEQLIKQATEI